MVILSGGEFYKNVLKAWQEIYFNETYYLDNLWKHSAADCNLNYPDRRSGCSVKTYKKYGVESQESWRTFFS